MQKVSFITGFYKRPGMVERTIVSMAEQTYPCIEVIAFDDCSPDETGDNLERIAERYSNVRILRHSTNKGFTSCLIEAIEGADGDFVAIQGSGDVSFNTRIAKQVELLNANPDIGVVGCYYENYEEESGLRRLRAKDATGYTLENLLKENPFTHGEVMFRRATYDIIGGYRKEFVYSQDYDLWLRFIRIQKLATVKECLYRRYVQFSGVTYTPSKSLIQGAYSITCKKMAMATESEREEIWNKLVTKGPLAVVPKQNRDLQKRLVKNTLRLLAWGSDSGAKEMTTEVTNPFVRSFLLFLCRVVRLPGVSTFRNHLLRGMGVSSK